MNMKNRATLGTVALLAALLAAALAPAAEKDFSIDPDYWALVFENDTPKAMVLDDPAGRLTYYWYMVFRVKNAR